MGKITTVSISTELLTALKEFKEKYGFHSMNETLWQLLTSAKIKILKAKKK